jgi:hypothetical protein
VTINDPGEYIAWPNGGNAVVDRRTAAALHVAEKRLGYNLTVIKGHDPGESAVSSNTHKGTGVVDLSPYDAKRKVHVLDELGFSAYERPAIPGLWPHHIHAILRGLGHGLDPEAQRQVEDWLDGKDGLKDHGPDQFPWRPDPVPEPFSYKAWLADGARAEKITGLTARIKTLREQIQAAKTRRAMLKSKMIYR